MSADIAAHEEEGLNRSHPPEQIQISPRLITHLIRKSPNRKAPGPDKITATQLKNLPSKTIVQIYYIFKACLQISYFPNAWKIAKVHPIPKPGKNKTVLQNYRPISLLSTLSKILEKIILMGHTQLGKHLIQNNIIIPQQYGFREKHSCIHQVLRVAEYITIELNKNRYAQMALLDIEKAFDSVWHDVLIFKLRRIQAPRKIINIIRNYLNSRRFYVEIKGSKSSIRNRSPRLHTRTHTFQHIHKRHPNPHQHTPRNLRG